MPDDWMWIIFPDFVEGYIQSLLTMSWVIFGGISHIMLAGFIALMMLIAIMKGIGVVLRR